MERLVFGTRARRRAARRARYKRLSVWVWLATVASMALGVPGSEAGINLWRDVFDGAPYSARPTGVETSESAASLLRFRSRSFESRPDPTPSPEEASSSSVSVVPAAPAVSDGSTQSIVYAAAQEFGIDGDLLLSLASCESGLDPGAYNPAGYHGLFQFDSSTWAAYGYGSIYDPTAQARTAARLLAAGQSSRWPNCL